MAEERPTCYNDTEPFKSAVYSASNGLPGLQEFDLLIQHHDMVIGIVENEVDTAHVLYLQNIREDTLSEAKTAIDNFLDKFESLGDGDAHQNTAFQNFGLVCEVLDGFADYAKKEVDKVKQELINIENDSFQYPKRAKDTVPGKINPVCEMIAACNDFLDQAGSIMSKSYKNHRGHRPERDAEIWMSDSYLFHQCIQRYLGEQIEIRDLTFHWHVKEGPKEQRTFHVRF
ncbi:unnamed protein product [Clonostachys rosea]|uniref:Fungal N-terminal domain-containing protein n=1 Tax=Bionectria ochroleuca TaxID=29856 RepID=A0ABY6TNF5_BIOOC|nr:unnamed protein product [Clonostachys rosea]